MWKPNAPHAGSAPAPPERSASTYISYAREDSEFALRLAKDLKALGANVWLDQLDVPLSRAWDESIEEALNGASQVLCILSPGAAGSTNFRDEFLFARQQKKQVITLMQQDCTVPLLLQDQVSVDFRTDYASALVKLLSRLQVPRIDWSALQRITDAEEVRKVARVARDTRSAAQMQPPPDPPAGVTFAADTPDETLVVAAPRDEVRTAAEPPARVDPPFDAYLGDQPYLFASYSHYDARVVFPLLEELNGLGFRIWYDEGIASGSEWPEFIASALGRAACFVVFISPAAVQSPNVRNEINFALKRKKQFLAIHISETTLPDGLELTIGARQAILRWNLPEKYFTKKVLADLPVVTRGVGEATVTER